MKLAQGGKTWILTLFLASVIFLFFTILLTGSLRSILLFITIILSSMTLLLLVFFRDPQREISSGIVASADGIIREISTIQDPDCGECKRVSTFMNLHNVHVNRSPIQGTVVSVTHIPGSHLPAFTKESERNERVITILQTPENHRLKIVQIAGTLARRIVPYIKQGDQLKAGDKIGLIRLGSRVDVYLPKNYKITCTNKQRIKAGEDIIALSHA